MRRYTTHVNRALYNIIIILKNIYRKKISTESIIFHHTCECARSYQYLYTHIYVMLVYRYVAKLKRIAPMNFSKLTSFIIYKKNNNNITIYLFVCESFILIYALICLVNKNIAILFIWHWWFTQRQMRTVLYVCT